jgi:RNA polymerase sigma factor (sigma-70 family)
VNPWQKKALAHWEQINRMARRRFQHTELAEEAALFVMDGLARNDWQRLRVFAGKSSLTTYVGAVTLRLLEDFARTRFGRAKPPQWIRRLGGIWTTLFRLLCLERFSPAEAVAIISDRVPEQERTVEQAAYQILGEIPSCGEHQGETTGFCEQTTLPAGEPECSPQEQHLERGQRRQLFTILGRVLFGDAGKAVDARLLERVTAARISLEPRERLLLQLCYRDGMAVAEAGRMLGWNRHQVHGRLRRLLARLQQDFAAAGLDEELRQLL